MTFIDIRTLLISYVVSGALGVAVMTSLWQQNRRRSSQIILWPINYAMQFVAFLLIALRGVIPDFFSIVLANTFLITGAVILYIGLERYVGKESQQLHNYVMVIIFTLIHTSLTFWYPSLALRNVNLSLAILFICVQISWLMLRRVGPALRPATRATGIVSAALGLVSLGHIIANLTLPQTNDLFSSGLINALLLLAYQILFIALTYTLFLLVSHQLLTALESELVGRQRTQKELKASQEKFQGLVETLYDWIWETDTEGCYTYVSPQIKNILGYEPQEVLGKAPYDLMSSTEASRVSKIFCALIEKQKPIGALENVTMHKDGHSIILETNGLPFYDIKGIFKGYRGANRDITKRKQAEETLKSEQQRLAYILEGTNAGTWEWNVQTGEMIYNERWAEIIGYTLAELDPISADTWTKLAHPDDLKGAQMLLEKHFRKELPYYEYEARLRHKNGSWVWVLDRGKVVTWTEDGRPLVMSGTHQDITKRKLTEEKIKHMATHDGLTDLPTLRLAEDRLALALGMSRRYKDLTAVMFIDLDGFKNVNDTLGHAAGDYVLKQVAQRLLSSIRETDTVARVGGDEFLIITPGLHIPENAAQIAKKVINLVSQPLIFNEQQVTIGASIGIALYPIHAKEAGQLIKRADEAMYKIKNAGKNGFIFADAAKE